MKIKSFKKSKKSAPEQSSEASAEERQTACENFSREKFSQEAFPEKNLT